ncbi:MAG TPA: M28 family peptidase [Solirubrobacteraceae bacterium]|nr:M28 family peptidase [Solirubrobacteraceae bacterium]
MATELRDPQALEEAVRHLAGIERPSASPGEREAAEWIAARLRELGCTARVEEERAHGTYWWPLGLGAAAGAAGGLLARRGGPLARLAGGALAAAGAAAIADDITGGRQWFRRRALPLHPTHNVVASAGDPSARCTLVIVAHHDAARTSLVFDPRPLRALADRFPDLYGRINTTPALMWPVFGGPALVALAALLGRRRALAVGTALSAGTVASMAEIGAHGTVPGANDNLTGVATLLGVAGALADDPVEGLRVLLVSTGSEESLMEGMQAFGRRHFASLPRESTHVLCVDTVGSPHLLMLEGEGMLRMNEYPPAFKALVRACADEANLELWSGLRFRNATDGLIALRAGYPTVMLGSCDRYKLPSNYHWPTDTADNVDFSTVRDAVVLCTAVARRLAGS